MINIRQNKGFALVFSLMFLFLIVSFMAVYILAVAEGVSQANSTANLKRAYYVADAGLADAYEKISQAGISALASSTCVNPNIPSTCSVPFIPSATTDNGVYSVGLVNSSYKVSIVYSNTPRPNYIITSTGTYGNQTKTLQLKMISSTLATFAYWSNTEINPTLGTLWWVTGNLTIGPIHTNGTLNIWGNPVFDGAVSEGGASPNYMGSSGTHPYGTSTPATVFPDGLTNSAPAVSAPPAATLSSLNTTASSGGLVLTGASTIIFNPAGTITVTGKVVNSSCTTTTTYSNKTISMPSNGVIYVQSTKTIPACHSSTQDGNATVQGTVNGQLTVAADQNVYISGNVAYNTNPRTNPSSTDMLGLVANNNVTVIEADCPAQLEVDAVLMALQGSFNVDQYSKNPDPITGGLDGAIMDQFGSLINDFSGATDTVNSSNKVVSGWLQDQSYDTRLAVTAPPGFPPFLNSSGYAVYTEQGITECLAGTCG